MIQYRSSMPQIDLHGEDRIKENPPGNINGWVFGTEFAQQDGIYRPGGRCEYGKQVAGGGQLQIQPSIAHHQENTDKCCNKPMDPRSGKGSFPGEQMRGYRSQDGGAGYQQADIGRLGIGERCIFRPKIKGTSKNRQDQAVQLDLPPF